MREALSGTSSQCFTVSPALISIFGGCGWLVLVVFVLGFLFFVLFCVSCCFLLPSRVRSFELCANSMQS